MATQNPPARTGNNPISQLKGILSTKSVEEQISNAIGESAPLFIASLIDIAGSDNRLQECNPTDIVREALKAATLKLPINRGLGFAWLVPRKTKGRMVPVFQIGYKGLIQLAQRTGAYKYINADVVYDGELVGQSKLTGEIDLSGEKKSDKVIGFFAYIETLTGFRKTAYASVSDMDKHAKKYSDSYGKDFSAWSTSYESMGIKTVLTFILSKYGVLSVEMCDVLSREAVDNEADRRHAEGVMSGQVIDVEQEKQPVVTEKMVECPDREGSAIKSSYCTNECKKSDGCPSFTEAAGEVVIGAKDESFTATF